MSDAVIYHGTPLTPRAALLDVCAGRAMCVSFYRPDNVNDVEAISPTIMYDNGAFSFWKQAAKSGQEWAGDRDWTPFLSVAGASSVSSRPVGGHPRYARRTEPAQRQPPAGMAVRTEGRASLAHGRADRTTLEALREVRPGLSGMDGCRQGYRLRGLSKTDGRGRASLGEPLASPAYDAWNEGGVRLSVLQRGQYVTRTEWMAL